MRVVSHLDITKRSTQKTAKIFLKKSVGKLLLIYKTVEKNRCSYEKSYGVYGRELHFLQFRV